MITLISTAHLKQNERGPHNQEHDILFIFALRIQLVKCRKALFDLICFDRYFLNVGGWQRDLKCAFLGESGMSIRSR